MCQLDLLLLFRFYLLCGIDIIYTFLHIALVFKPQKMLECSVEVHSYFAVALIFKIAETGC